MSKQSDIVLGIHAVQALIERSPERFIEMWALKGRDDERMLPIINLARKYKIPVQFVHRKVLD